jgi:DNA polymerase I-like protein with 3'-5' exonuclease and polymerase domains
VNILILDVETTISNKGNPFDITNKCVCVGLKYINETRFIFYEEQFDYIQDIINNAAIIVGFNIKFDLHWLRRIGVDISKIRVWDCQLAEFLLNNQQTKYPSLNEAAIKYSLPMKLDVVKSEYWDKGIDTDQIPREVLSEYLTQDLVLTQQVFERQRKQFGV